MTWSFIKSLRGRAPAALAIVIACAGCSSEEPAASASAKSNAKGSGKAVAATPATPAPESTGGFPKSIFGTGSDARDPFFPNSTRGARAAAAAAAAAEDATPEAGAAEIPRLLQEGFMGIIGTGANRLAIVNNVILEPNRSTSIPIRSGNRERQVSVRCREILRNAIILEVEGIPAPVTLQPSIKNKF